MKWTKDTIIANAKSYTKRSEWVNSPSYKAAQRLDILDNDEIVRHFKQKSKTFWNKDSIISSAKKYKTKSEWYKNDYKAYDAARRHELLNDSSVTGHFDSGLTYEAMSHPKYTKQQLLEESSKYENMSEFRYKNYKMYKSAEFRGYLDEIYVYNNWKKYIRCDVKRVVYLLNVKGTNIYKIGITSSGTKYNRKHVIERDCGVELEIIVKRSALNATKLERKALAIGEHVKYNCAGGTEFRKLTPQQLEEVVDILLEKE